MNLQIQNFYKKLIKKYLILFILLLSITIIKIPMFTFIAESGHIFLYASEIIIAIITLIFIYKIMTRKYILNDKELKLLYIVVTFLTFYVILTIFRYFLHYNFK